MTTLYTLTYLGAVISALLLTPLAIVAARRWGVVDLPNSRKIHENPTPRLGGLAIAAAFLITVAGALILSGLLTNAGRPLPGQVITVLVAGAAALCVGLADDLLDLPSRFKLLVLFAAAAAVCGSGVRIDNIVLNTHVVLKLGWLAWPVTVLWIVGITVSINFIDGLDGLAGGIASIACGVVAVVASLSGQPVSAVLSLALLGSLTGFLFFNFNPAKIFMGDCGSMFTGFTLASLSVTVAPKAGTMTGLVLPMIALSVPLLDTLLTIIRRGVIQRRSIFSAERGHIHHRLLDMGLRHVHAVLLLYAVSAAAAGIGLVALYGDGWATAGGMALLLPLLLGLFRAAGSTRARETLTAVRRNRFMSKENTRYQRGFEEMQLRFRQAQTFEAWWSQVCATAATLDFVRITLPLTRRDGTSHVLKWKRVDDPFADSETVSANVPVPQRRNGPSLRAEIELHAGAFLESAGHRIALFSRLMAEQGVDSLPPAATAGAERPEQEPDDGAEVLPEGVRVAIVHDFLYTYSGAERVLEQIIKVFPGADLFSLFDFLPQDQRAFLADKPVKTSFIQRLPGARKRHRLFLPLMPLAIEQLDVSNYDIVISSSYVAAKGVITRPDQLHVCYCHTPVRFAWDMQNQYLGQSGLLTGLRSVLARMILHYIRTWDVRSSNGVDLFVTNSDFVGRRIKKVYRRSSTTIYPPVDTRSFTLQAEKENFYLTASRLVSYKRIDVIIEAFNRMPDRRLIVVGEGPDFEKLRAKAGPNIRMLGHQPFDRLRRYMQLAKGFVFAAEEDFGIMPVEAQACGTPVIAFDRGGVTESVIADETGVFFREQTPESLIAAIERFEQHGTWDAATIRDNTMRFSASCFRETFGALVRSKWEQLSATARKSPRQDVRDATDLAGGGLGFGASYADMPEPAIAGTGDND